MSKPSKRKNGKVPKITEEEYAAYLSALKNAPTTTNTITQAEKPPVKGYDNRIT
jgi:hypothetical protein